VRQKAKNNNYFKLDYTFFENNDNPEFAQLLQNNKKKATKVLNDFLIGLKNEASDSKETSRIIYKFMLEQKITKKEEKQLKTRIADMFKIIGVGVPFMLIPGASLLIPFILKVAEKKGIDLYPSNFKGTKD